MSSNPYGLMNQSRYNFFSHLRSILYGEDTEITGIKRVSVSEFENGLHKIQAYFNELNAEILQIKKKRDETLGRGFHGIQNQIELENAYLKLNAFLDYRENITALHRCFHSSHHMKGKNYLTFSAMMKYFVSYGSFYIGDPHREKEAKHLMHALKLTLNKPFLELSNKYL